MENVKTLMVKVRKAAKNYPDFGITKGEQIYKWRAGGKKHISLTDPRPALAPEGGPEASVVEPVTEGEVAKPKPVAKKRGRPAKAKITPVTEDMPPE